MTAENVLPVPRDPVHHRRRRLDPCRRPPSSAQDVKSVQTRVDTLFHQAEQASERYNNARLQVSKAQTRLTALRADLRRQRSKVDSVRRQVAAAVVSQYQGQALSSTTQVLLADNPDAFLNQLSTVSAYNDQRSQMMADFALQAKQLEMRQAAATRELNQVAATKKQLGAEKARINDREAAAKQLLGKLKDRAAAKASRSSARSAPAGAPASALRRPGGRQQR